MKSLMHTVARTVVCIYNKTHWFTDKEAWWLYRLGAVLEATGWTLLIGAIVYRHMGLPQYESVVTVAGRIHGMFFMCYFGAVLVTARSMQWGIVRLLAALIAGVPPYTSLIFEQAMAYDRRKRPVFVAPPANIDE